MASAKPVEGLDRDLAVQILEREWKVVTTAAGSNPAINFVDDPGLRERISSSINHNQVAYRFCLPIQVLEAITEAASSVWPSTIHTALGLGMLYDERTAAFPRIRGREDVNLKRFANDVVDVDEVVAKEIKPSGILLTFRNGEQMELAWKNEVERTQILAQLEAAKPERKEPGPSRKGF